MPRNKPNDIGDLQPRDVNRNHTFTLVPSSPIHTNVRHTSRSDRTPVLVRHALPFSRRIRSRTAPHIGVNPRSVCNSLTLLRLLGVVSTLSRSSSSSILVPPPNSSALEPPKCDRNKELLLRRTGGASGLCTAVTGTGDPVPLPSASADAASPFETATPSVESVVRPRTTMREED